MNDQSKMDNVRSYRGALTLTFKRIWIWWERLINQLPDRIFAPEVESTPTLPSQDSFIELAMADDGVNAETALTQYERARDDHNALLEQRKIFHEETSKTIRRVFYTLIGTCLFCVITLAGSPDAQLLTTEATVKLPILNYEMGFEPFLIVGPVVLIALLIYLQIFVGQHRLYEIASESRQAMLANFDGLTPKIAVLVIFYWMVPITLAMFTWKGWPRPVGGYLFYTTLAVAVVSVVLQFRRTPRLYRGTILPLLAAALTVFIWQVDAITSARRLNLFKANLTNADLRGINLSGAFLSEANLSGANLFGANLDHADISYARLDGADLVGAHLQLADIRYTRLEGANLAAADLRGAKLDHANLKGAMLHHARLSGASLRRADLQGALLQGARLIEATLPEAILRGASLQGTLLHAANLTRADLRGAILRSTNLPGAVLRNASLEGASLEFANLQGAVLNGANLQGASLKDAGLQGASLKNANLQGASLEGASLEHTKLRDASLKNTYLWRAYGQPDIEFLENVFVYNPQIKAVSAEDVNALKSHIESDFFIQNERPIVVKRLARLSMPPADVRDSLSGIYWKRFAEKATILRYNETLARRLLKLACSESSNHYVVQGLLRGRSNSVASRFEEIGSPHAERLAYKLLIAVDRGFRRCQGMKGIDAASIAKLRKLSEGTLEYTTK